MPMLYVCNTWTDLHCLEQPTPLSRDTSCIAHHIYGAFSGSLGSLSVPTPSPPMVRLASSLENIYPQEVFGNQPSTLQGFKGGRWQHESPSQGHDKLAF